MDLSLQSQLDLQLPNQSRMNRVFSEREGGHRAPVHTFPVNEDTHCREILARVVQDAGKPHDKPRLHLGVAGFFNFDVAACGKHDGLILADINTDQVAFWRSVIQLVATSPTPNAFREAFCAQTDGTKFSLLPPESEFRPMVELRYEDLQRKSSLHSPIQFLAQQRWLKSPELYQRIHEMAKDGRIASIELNLFDAAQCRGVREAVSKLKIDGQSPTLATVYGSNVYDLYAEHPTMILPKIMQLCGRPLSIVDEHNPAVEQWDKIKPGTPIFERLADIFETIVSGSVRAERKSVNKISPEKLPSVRKADIHASIEGFTEAVIDLYRDPAFRELMTEQDRYKYEKDDAAHNKRVMHTCCVDAQRYFSALALHPALDEKKLHRMGLVAPDTMQVYSKPANGPEHVSYDAIGQLAGEDTVIFNTSIRPRPMVMLSGPPSPHSDWRQGLRQRGKRLPTSRDASDMIGMRL